MIGPADHTGERAPERRGAAIRRESERAAAAFPALFAAAERLARSVAAGAHGRRQAGAGEEFWQHRPYSFGDPVSAIDWRQSARASERLFVREREWQLSNAVHLWRDGSSSLDYAFAAGADTKGRRADIIATALAILLSRAGERVGLIGARARPFQGRSAPSLILQGLLDLAERGGVNEAPSSPPAGAAQLVYFSDFFCALDQLEQSVARAAQTGRRGVLFQVLDPSEEDFPFAGRVEFQDVESRDRTTFGDASALKPAYTAALAAHRVALERICGRHGWVLLRHRTDAPATAALLALYLTLDSTNLRR